VVSVAEVASGAVNQRACVRGATPPPRSPSLTQMRHGYARVSFFHLELLINLAVMV
jgi:hypothetical protein